MITRVYANEVAKSSNTCPYPPKTADALAWAFYRMSMEVRYNVRSHNTEWRTGGDGIDDDDPWGGAKWYWLAWKLMTSRSMAHIRSNIQTFYNLTFGRDAFTDALDAMLYGRESDPLKDYFESLPAVTGRNILPNVLSTRMNVTEGSKELAVWASKYMFLGVVWRAYEPGTKLDEIPILVGPGGIGKSMFLTMAVPQDIPGLYGSGVELSGNPKSLVEGLQGKAICEISEMVGAGTGDMARIKDYISRTDDGAVRLSYRRDPEPTPRRCIMGSTLLCRRSAIMGHI